MRLFDLIRLSASKSDLVSSIIMLVRELK